MRPRLLPTLTALCLVPLAAYAGDEVEVETRNIYLGASLNGVLAATTPQELALAVDAALAEVNATDFPTRAEALADEIASDRPHLIGIQEASLFRCDTPSDEQFVPPNASGTCPVPGSGDYLADLLAAVNSHRKLVRRGLSYVTVASVQNADLESPCFGPLVCRFPIDARLTDRDVILARSDILASVTPIPYILGCVNAPVSSGVMGVPNTGCNFQAAAPALGSAILRGFVGVTATVEGQAIQFVNTHLEVQGALIGNNSPTGQAFFQAAQAQEFIVLLDAFAVPGVPIVPVGDYNSSPEDPLLVTVPSPPFPVPAVVPPYHQMVAAGYEDVAPRGDDDDDDDGGSDGFTCCQNSSLSNPDSILDERIDLVFATGELDEGEAEVIGDEPIGGLPNWASDHAGVVAELEFDDDDDDDDDDD